MEDRLGLHIFVKFFFFFLIFFCTGRVPDPTSLFPPDLILYVNLVAKGAPKFFKTLAPRLTVLDIPYFADAYSRTVRPIQWARKVYAARKDYAATLV